MAKLRQRQLMLFGLRVIWNCKIFHELPELIIKMMRVLCEMQIIFNFKLFGKW